MQFPDDENRDNSQNIGLFAFQTPDADGSPKIFYWIVRCLKQQILEFCCIYLSSYHYHHHHSPLQKITFLFEVCERQLMLGLEAFTVTKSDRNLCG